MANISSINFQKSKDFQVFHNSSMRPDYAIGGELLYNHKGYEALKIKQEMISNAIEAYENRTGQKFQAKSYEWSAVVNLKADSTMQDLEKLAKHFQDKYGFQCYQIAIHRDEGYIDEQGNKHINHHAHLEFITLDKESGKSLFRAELQRPKALRQIQSEVAEILQMERGQDKRISGAKRVEPRIYAKMKEQSKQELRKENAKNKELQAELLTQTQIELALKLKNKDELIQNLENENEALKELNKTMIKGISELRRISPNYWQKITQTMGGLKIFNNKITNIDAIKSIRKKNHGISR